MTKTMHIFLLHREPVLVGTKGENPKTA